MLLTPPTFLLHISSAPTTHLNRLISHPRLYFCLRFLSVNVLSIVILDCGRPPVFWVQLCAGCLVEGVFWYGVGRRARLLNRHIHPLLLLILVLARIQTLHGVTQTRLLAQILIQLLRDEPVGGGGVHERAGLLHRGVAAGWTVVLSSTWIKFANEALSAKVALAHLARLPPIHNRIFSTHRPQHTRLPLLATLCYWIDAAIHWLVAGEGLVGGLGRWTVVVLLLRVSLIIIWQIHIFIVTSQKVSC